ncbi:MAG: 4-(cytidine 5'-diphospho)-2-C-methyl-D-erythritol kinase [Xanthomonadaceae bacterium]|nr:4-(cytidine 5'-diphospho)-2-C-methyl-D-erythritol kinase [Xanthomonadaceae bacterium]
MEARRGRAGFHRACTDYRSQLSSPQRSGWRLSAGAETAAVVCGRCRKPAGRPARLASAAGRSACLGDGPARARQCGAAGVRRRRAAGQPRPGRLACRVSRLGSRAGAGVAACHLRAQAALQRASVRGALGAAVTAPAWTLWPAPAKLNLFLHILGRRADGYHRLQTVFRLLDWGDSVRLRPRADGAIVRVAGAQGIAADDDLAVRAARALKVATGCPLGVEIAVDKRIPVGAGLGGGSSDAATTLVALNRIWGCGLDDDALAALGLHLGADVPVFVRGHNAWAEGIGEVLTPIVLPPRWYVLLDPGVHVATAPLFQAPELTRNAAEETIPRFLDGMVTGNAFEPVVRARHPAVAMAMSWLAGSGLARLSGSGGSVFLETRSHADAADIAARCPVQYTARVARGAEISALTLAVERFSAGASPSW